MLKSDISLGRKNPADSLSRQLVSDALVRKGSVEDANAEYVQKLRVSKVATDQEIQAALHKLFQSSPQGISAQSPQGSTQSTNDGPRHPIIAATSVSRI